LDGAWRVELPASARVVIERRPLQLAARTVAVLNGVARVDAARVGVRASVDRVVPGHVVLRLEEVVPGFIGLATLETRPLVPEVVVALAAVELVVLVSSLDVVVVLLSLDDVGPVLTAQGV